MILIEPAPALSAKPIASSGRTTSQDFRDTQSSTDANGEKPLFSEPIAEGESLPHPFAPCPPPLFPPCRALLRLVPFNPFLSVPAGFCPVLHRPVLVQSYPAPPRSALFCPAPPRPSHALPRLVSFTRVLLSCPLLAYLAQSCSALSCRVLPCHAPLCPVRSSPALVCLVLSCTGLRVPGATAVIGTEPPGSWTPAVGGGLASPDCGLRQARCAESWCSCRHYGSDSRGKAASTARLSRGPGSVASVGTALVKLGVTGAASLQPGEVAPMARPPSGNSSQFQLLWFFREHGHTHVCAHTS